jgi:hypothetical protein
LLLYKIMFISGIYLYPCEIKFLSDLRKVGGTPVSFVSKAHHHDIAELLLKVALNTITKPNTYIPVDHYVVS